jgi:hypothetical protein
MHNQNRIESDGKSNRKKECITREETLEKYLSLVRRMYSFKFRKYVALVIPSPQGLHSGTH